MPITSVIARREGVRRARESSWLRAKIPRGPLHRGDPSDLAPHSKHARSLCALRQLDSRALRTSSAPTTAIAVATSSADALRTHGTQQGQTQHEGLLVRPASERSERSAVIDAGAIT